ncbi:hydrogenase nickel incorporation protein HypB [Bradyrhizobium sp. CB3481]|uniref:hydrogenase nickel incorporation protein HypB n=1 Tax=Bradyrhizobium sp. CB3481 TaxID=3039158 RepID=UPI0024B10F0E|nr:hydrogenase nickel incorporation protein HypB [Bradyrhizobium sp. CB3481]WFU20628.1 hydrogenase nickel incorporation protein HypB [Bradyrhizobium sp. CB3481]
MCIVCGCSKGLPSANAQGGQAQDYHHDHPHDRCDHHHDHGHGGHGAHHHHHHDHHHRLGRSHDHAHARDGLVNCGFDPAGLNIMAKNSDRIIRIERDILAKNNTIAADNRTRFLADELLVFNLVSSPGAGKTSLLVRTVSELKENRPVGVVVGDQQTSNDADRIRATGVTAIQINTGNGCHLDATMVEEAYRRLPPLKGGILFIENVGNLVCPATFDLGEACKIVVFSTTEGEDKPLKYPDMFAASALMLINKIDLAPVLEFDLAQTVAYARRVNPKIEVLTVSARTGEGFAAFYAWIGGKQAAHQRRPIVEAATR